MNFATATADGKFTRCRSRIAANNLRVSCSMSAPKAATHWCSFTSFSKVAKRDASLTAPLSAPRIVAKKGFNAFLNLAHHRRAGA